MPPATCSRNRQHRRLTVLLLMGALETVASSGHASAATETTSAIELHIQHVQNALLPPVLVEPEPDQAPTLSDRMASLHVPGVSIAVIHDGKLEWARGFGVSKIGGPTVTPNTLFEAASISKSVTALAALHLVQTGKIDLDTDVNRYLRAWKIPANEFTDQKAVTLRELLSHTAGVTVHGFLGYASDAPVPNLQQILDGLPPANSPAIRVNVVPGTIWRYSGGGYVVVQKIIEDVTSKPFAEVMNSVVLTPLGMMHSSYAQPFPKNKLSALAAPYDADGNPVKGGPRIHPEMAPGGLWTTPSDLARFALEIQLALQGQSRRVLSTSLTRKMLAPGLRNWGLGVGIGGDPRKPYFQNGGASPGYRCQLVSYETGDGAVIMTNGDNGGQLAQELLRTIAHEYHWPDFQPSSHRAIKVDPAQFDLLTGSYQVDPNFALTITRDGNHLISQATGQRPVEIFAESEREYFFKIDEAHITFDTNDQGQATRLVLHQNDRDMPAPRLDDAAAKPIREALAAANRRFLNQTPAPDSEPTLRQLISDLAAGTPNYEKMNPSMAASMRQQLGQLPSLLNHLGAVQSVTFKAVAPDGADVYSVTFAHGSAEIALALQADGIIADVGFLKVAQ